MECSPLQQKALKRCKTEQPLPGKPVPVATNPSTGRWSIAIIPCGTRIAGRKANICWPMPHASHARSPRPWSCLHGSPLTNPSVLSLPRPVACLSAVQEERTRSSSAPTRNAWKQSVRSVAFCWMCRVWCRVALATATKASAIGVRIVPPTHGKRCRACVMLSPLFSPL
jgi:hypothetical protein